MPKVSWDSATEIHDRGPVEDRHADLDGYTANFVSLRQDMDLAPLLRGLPGDLCPCPHWGYVIKGTLTWRFADHEEVFEAGDAFYAPPGHALGSAPASVRRPRSRGMEPCPWRPAIGASGAEPPMLLTWRSARSASRNRAARSKSEAGRSCSASQPGSHSRSFSQSTELTKSCTRSSMPPASR